MLNLSVLLLLSVLASAFAESPQLLFREDWKETPPELPVSQAHVANSSLILTTHGPGEHGIKKSHHDWIENDPFYVWSGACPGNWAVSLRIRDRLIDLSGDARVRWRSRQSGFRQLRLILKLSDGSWIVSDQYDGESKDWRVHEFVLKELRWRKLNISRVSEEGWIESPGLNRVVEVGFTDLMPGGMSPACSRLDWIEVHGAWTEE